VTRTRWRTKLMWLRRPYNASAYASGIEMWLTRCSMSSRRRSRSVRACSRCPSAAVSSACSTARSWPYQRYTRERMRHTYSGGTIFDNGMISAASATTTTHNRSNRFASQNDR